MKIFSFSSGKPVWKKYEGLFKKYPQLQGLLSGKVVKIPKNLRGIEDKHMLKKAIEKALFSYKIPFKKITVEEKKNYYIVKMIQ